MRVDPMPPPRTAYVLLWFPKPSETFVYAEALGLWRLGLPLRVYTLYGPLRQHLSPPMRSLPMPVERLGLAGLPRTFRGLAHWLARRPSAWRALWREVPWRRWGGWESGGENLLAFWSGFELARRCQEQGVEHIHAPWARGTATAAWVAWRLTGIPFSFTGRAHDLQPPDGALADKLKDASFMRCESLSALRHVARRFPGLAHKLVLTYNPLPSEGHPLAPAPMDRPYRLLALGRLVNYKGFDHLLTACHLLQGAGLDFTLTLAGDGPLRASLERQSRRLGLAGRVEFPGFVSHDRVPELFRHSDLFVMPSVVNQWGGSDGLPTVILEALAMGLPVVATRVAGIGEVIRHGLTGWLVPPGDAKALAGAVLEITADRGRALAVALKGRQLVLERFDPQANCRRLLELYRGAGSRSE
jgi:glycosyltransferase involved in cell wall biosynthesis